MFSILNMGGRRMRRSNKILLFMVLLPLFMTLILLLASFEGVEDCSILSCYPDKVRGFDAVIQTGSYLIIFFYPIYIQSFIILFGELYKSKAREVKQSVLYVIVGSVSLCVSFLLFVLGLFLTKWSLKSIFLMVFFHPFILLCNLIGIHYLVKSFFYQKKIK